MNKNKEKMEKINAIIDINIKSLNSSDEDKFLINELVSSYYRKRIGISNSAPDVIAAAFVWAYSKSNFMW